MSKSPFWKGQYHTILCMCPDCWIEKEARAREKIDRDNYATNQYRREEREKARKYCEERGLI